MVKLQAHRGVSSEYPENTVAAFRASVEEGYDLIECDLKYTKDGEIVVLHDPTVNRTARKQNGESIADPLRIDHITLAEARELEYGAWKHERFKGEPIPTLAELLDFAAQSGIPIKIDNCWERFPDEIKESMFSQIEARGEAVKVGFTCAKLETLKLAADRFPNAMIHYDGGDLSRERLDQVAELAKGHPLAIWVCFDNDMTRWFQGTKATAEVCSFVRTYGELGVWILSRREELEPAIREFGAEIIETTGHIKPQWLEDFEA